MSKIPSNKVTWFQIPADDPERAWAFYAHVFGWSAEDVYRDEMQVGAVNGEIAPRNEELPSPRLIIRVEDVEASLASIQAAGGQIVAAVRDIEEIGMRFAVFRDTEGNLMNVVGDITRSNTV